MQKLWCLVPYSPYTIHIVCLCVCSLQEVLIVNYYYKVFYITNIATYIQIELINENLEIFHFQRAKLR
jgi:hypothetical protein